MINVPKAAIRLLYNLNVYSPWTFRRVLYIKLYFLAFTKFVGPFKSGMMDENIVIFPFHSYEAVASIKPPLYNTFQLLHLLL